MTKIPINYQKGVIYFVFYNNILIYIGSTTDFTRRKWGHKTRMNTKSQLPFYKFLNENNILFEDLRWECEDFPCNSKNELIRQEGLKIRELEPICNKCVAGRTYDEWYEDNKEIISNKLKIYRENNKEQRKEYLENNKEQIKLKEKEYRENNKEKIKEYRENNKEKIKEYCEKNKDKLKTYKKEYYEKNKEKILNKQKEYYEKNKIN
jgi:hypothetical protein